MSLRSISETIEDLRKLLHKFERSPEADEFALVELKRILLDRIAELEAERAMNGEVIPMARSSLKRLKDTTAQVPAQKLD